MYSFVDSCDPGSWSAAACSTAYREARFAKALPRMKASKRGCLAAAEWCPVVSQTNVLAAKRQFDQRNRSGPGSAADAPPSDRITGMQPGARSKLVPCGLQF